jgi:hypothetical protein
MPEKRCFICLHDYVYNTNTVAWTENMLIVDMFRVSQLVQDKENIIMSQKQVVFKTQKKVYKRTSSIVAFVNWDQLLAYS